MQCKRQLVIYYFACDAITKYHSLAPLHNRNLFSHAFGGWKPKTKVVTGLVPHGASFLGLWLISLMSLPAPRWTRVLLTRTATFMISLTLDHLKTPPIVTLEVMLSTHALFHHRATPFYDPLFVFYLSPPTWRLALEEQGHLFELYLSSVCGPGRYLSHGRLSINTCLMWIVDQWGGGPPRCRLVELTGWTREVKFW